MPKLANTSTLWIALLTATGCNVINDGLLGPAEIDAAAIDANEQPVDAPATDGRPPPMPLPNVVLNYGFSGPGSVVFDYSGRDLDGELSDPKAWSDAGRVGGCITLDGVNPATQFVTLPNGVLDGVNDFTVSVWVRLAVSAPWARIYDIGNGQPDPANRFMFMTVSGFNGTTGVGLHTTSYGGAVANEIIVSANAFLPVAVWKHLALVGTAGARTLYVDGFPVAQVTGGPNVPPTEMEPLAPQSWLGRSRFPDPGLNGSLDEFRIYDRALNAGEVQDLAWPQQDYSHWRFDDATGTTLADRSDRGNTGTLHNNVTWASTGRLGGALDFPGGTSGTSAPYVSLAGSPLSGCTNQMTISSWVKLRTAASGTRIIDLGTGSGIVLYLSPSDGTGVHFTMTSTAGTFNLATASTLPADNDWHHVAVTYTSSNLVILYVDGVSMSQATSPTVRPSDFTATTENWIGRSRAGGPVVDGMVDELRIGCRSYTADEIKMLAHR